ncbi:unnamed protein product [Miscanthus lutarioriparius]|uniref:Uncharacterized protein n=1 Tax=Miscanthus lutarioriparius TaxID=422564 RepID=A0A811RS51_9POAL|nr:unnamed protein product [Miscanthus lutarioriparius]
MAGQTRPLARRAVALAPSHGRARCPRPPARRRGGPGAAAPRQGRGSMGPRRTAAPPARAAAPPAPRPSGRVDSNAVAATTSSELETRGRLRKLDIMVYLWLKFIAASNTDTFSNPTISGTSDPLYTNKSVSNYYHTDFLAPYYLHVTSINVCTCVTVALLILLANGGSSLMKVFTLAADPYSTHVLGLRRCGNLNQVWVVVWKETDFKD